MSKKINELSNGSIVKELNFKIIKKNASKPKPDLTVYKTLLTDGVELIQVVQFNKNHFQKFKETDTVKLFNFMPRETPKNNFWFRLNSKNLHLEYNNACKVELSDKQLDTEVEPMQISAIEQASIVDKSIISVKCVILNIKETVFGTKNIITSKSFDLSGINL
jgi:hypothetical protein